MGQALRGPGLPLGIPPSDELNALLRKAARRARCSAALEVSAWPLLLLASAVFLWETLARVVWMPQSSGLALGLGMIGLGAGLLRASRTPTACAVLHEAGNIAGSPLLFASLEHSENSALGALVRARAAAQAAAPSATTAPPPKLAVRLLPLALLLAVLAAAVPGREARATPYADSAHSVRAALDAARATLVYQAPQSANVLTADPAKKPAMLTAEAAAVEAALQADVRALARVAAALPVADAATTAQALAALAEKLRSNAASQEEREALSTAISAARTVVPSGEVAALLARLQQELAAGSSDGAASALAALAAAAAARAPALDAVQQLQFVLRATHTGAPTTSEAQERDDLRSADRNGARSSTAERQREPQHARVLERYFR